LALRRVFYLEFDHFESRKQQLAAVANLDDPEDPIQKERPPYIPHPEMRETIPNVSLYSVLYKLPEDYHSPNAATTLSLVDRQLSATVEFFDKCVPNQPGFSSSVAAVTILPDSSQVSHAWGKWYACAGKLRRLRFIRQQIQRLRKDEDEVVIEFPSVSEEDVQDDDTLLAVGPQGIPSTSAPAVDTSLNKSSPNHRRLLSTVSVGSIPTTNLKLLARMMILVRI